MSEAPSRPLLDYFGGKFSLAPWIVSFFPEHSIFVDAFGGGGSVLMHKPRSRIEIYNDIDERLVNLFKQVRDNAEILQTLLEFTPYARVEYKRSREASKCELESARRLLVQSWFGIGDSLANQSGFRNSKTQNTNPSRSFDGFVSEFVQFQKRLKGCYVEQLDFEVLIEKYDSDETLFYFDPPYVLSERSMKHGYTHDFTDEDHLRFVNALKKLKGMAIVSGYLSPHYEESLFGWKRVEKDAQTQVGKRTECLWLSPSAYANQTQMSLDV